MHKLSLPGEKVGQFPAKRNPLTLRGFAEMGDLAAGLWHAGTYCHPETCMFRRLFLDHPASVDETYLQHMAMAGSFGWAMLRASGACFVHALVPALCEKTGSGIIRQLHDRMVTNRKATPAQTPEEDDALLWIAANI